MASVKRVEYKSGRVVYRIVICQGYDKKGNKLVKNLTYSVNQSATPKQQEREAKKYAMDMEDKLKYGYQYFTKHLHRYNEWVQNNPDKAKAEGLEELPIIPLHGLRHSCATLLNYLEVNIIEISKTLGHSTCSTTMNIYAHSFEEQQEEVATKVNEFLRLNA